MKTTRIILFLICGILLWNPSVYGCSVCFSVKEETLTAYHLTTVFLSFLPLSMIGGLAYFFWSQAKKKREAEASILSQTEKTSSES
ncbi:MAG: hypothetical protein JKY51_02850 [Opitutaceae bacterium]|nr:hypothetical protein [Opitutaceae bacterium]